MRVTVDVELQDGEVDRALQVREALSGLKGVEVRLVTDKSALACRLAEALASKEYGSMASELSERLTIPATVDETLDVLCTAVLFSTDRVEKGRSVQPVIDILARLPDVTLEFVKTEIVKRAMSFLSIPRRLDCSRIPLLPYAETLASMVRAELLTVRSAVLSIVQMIRTDTTRSAGMTCLGKLVEIACEFMRRCDPQTTEALRAAVATAQQDDAFLYDVEYIMDAFCWSENKPLIALCDSAGGHVHPILALAYAGPDVSSREAIVTSSVDGAINTWNDRGMLTENILLSRHYALALDLANRGHTLVVGTAGRHPSTPPAVVLYNEGMVARECKWEESGAVEPEGARFITCLRSVRSAPMLRYCIGMNTSTVNVMRQYDGTQLVQEYHDHKDLITAMHIPTDRDSTVITGSRDCTVMVYDLRARQYVANVSHHTNTISGIGSYGDYIFTGGLDKRLIVQDVRMLSAPLTTRDFESAVVSLSLNKSMHCAIATLTGVYVINLEAGTSLPIFSRASSGALTPRYNAIAWNANGNVLYCGGDNMTLDIYTRCVAEPKMFDMA